MRASVLELAAGRIPRELLNCPVWQGRDRVVVRQQGVLSSTDSLMDTRMALLLTYCDNFTVALHYTVRRLDVSVF